MKKRKCKKCNRLRLLAEMPGNRKSCKFCIQEEKESRSYECTECKETKPFLEFGVVRTSARDEICRDCRVSMVKEEKRKTRPAYNWQNYSQPWK